MRERGSECVREGEMDGEGRILEVRLGYPLPLTSVW